MRLASSTSFFVVFVLSNCCVSHNSGYKKPHLRFEQLIKGGDLSHRATGSSWHRVWGSQSLHWIGHYLDSRRRWTRDSSWVLQSSVMSVLDSWIPSDVSRVRPLPWKEILCPKVETVQILRWVAKHTYEALPTNHLIFRRWTTEVGLRKGIEKLKV